MNANDGYKRVKIGPGQYAKFPESMADEEIEHQLQAHFGSQPSQQPSQPPPQAEAPAQPQGNLQQDVINAMGLNRTPGGNIMDFFHGFGKSAQPLANVFTGGQGASMPNIGQSNPNPIFEGAGSYAPYAMAGGTSLPGAVAAGGAYGFNQYEPGQHGLIDTTLNKIGGVPYGGRARNTIEDALLNMVFHGAQKPLAKLFEQPTAKISDINFKNQATFSPKEGEFGKQEFKSPTFLNEKQPEPLSGKITEDLSHNIMGNRNLEQSGKELASHVHDTYQHIKEQHSAEFDKIFNSPTGEISYHTDEPILVKDKLMHDSSYRRNDYLAESKDKNLKLLDEKFMNHPSVENGHKLQSELGSEVGYLKRQRENNLLDAEGKNRLNSYIQAQNAIQQDIRAEMHNISPELMESYDTARDEWRKNVIPYHTDKDLREIAEGRIKNPTAESVTGIFKNPEENINKVVADLPRESKDRIMHIALGKVKEDIKPEELLSARKSLDTNGLSSYVNPEHEQGFRNLRSNLQLEAERKLQSDAQEAFKEGLKQVQTKAESKRLKIANERDKGFNKAKADADKVLKNYQNQFNTDYQKGMQEAAKIEKQKNDLWKKIGVGGVILGGAKALGFEHADLLAAYLGAHYKGNTIKK